MKICSRCDEQIDLEVSPSYVVIEKQDTIVYHHTQCYYPNLLKQFKRLTRSYISRVWFEIQNKKLSEEILYESYKNYPSDDFMIEFAQDDEEMELNHIEGLDEDYKDYPSAA